MGTYWLPGEYSYKDINLLESLTPLSTVQELEHTALCDGDVIVDSYPKSGAPLVHEIFRLTTTTADIGTSHTEPPLTVSIPIVDFHLPGLAPLHKLKNLTNPRYMNSHFPSSIYQKNLDTSRGKFVVVLRNPKDVLVSYYHFYQGWSATGDGQGSFHDFFELFKAKRLLYGDWLDHVLGWWQYKDRPNVLIIKYEDLLADTKQAVRDISTFCGQELTEKRLKKVTEELSGSGGRMSGIFMVNSSVMPKHLDDITKPEFIMTGKVDSWAELSTPEMDAYIEENYVMKAKEVGLSFNMK